MLAASLQRWIGWKARPLLRIRYGSEDYAVVAGVPPARLELQPTRLPLQKLSIQRVEDNAFHLN
jgi:hypothetical protein